MKNACPCVWHVQVKITSCKSFFFLFPVRTCGKPNIQNIMNNVTVRPGQSATFKCQVDMSCIVAYIEWYHEMDNGTEKLIKVINRVFSPFKCKKKLIFWWLFNEWSLRLFSFKCKLWEGSICCKSYSHFFSWAFHPSITVSIQW